MGAVSKSNEGVAIQSTYRKLVEVLREVRNTTEIVVGPVEYIDYASRYYEYKSSFISLLL